MSLTSPFLSNALDWSQLPFLLRLMDDPSPKVRSKIAARLQQFGPEIWSRIEEEKIEISPAQRHALRELLVTSPRLPGTQSWPDWLKLRGENERLEAAFGWLSHWAGAHSQSEQETSRNLHLKLDGLARAYLAQGGTPDPEELSNFLFGKSGLRGATGEDYMNPQSSDLTSVLEKHVGLPISLSAIFILVGWRLDIAIYGCNFPGHFLARAPLNPGHASEEDLIFDVYHKGRILRPDEVRALRKVALPELTHAATAREIIVRVLRNLVNAYFQRGDQVRTRAAIELLSQLENTD